MECRPCTSRRSTSSQMAMAPDVRAIRWQRGRRHAGRRSRAARRCSSESGRGRTKTGAAQLRGEFLGSHTKLRKAPPRQSRGDASSALAAPGPGSRQPTNLAPWGALWTPCATRASQFWPPGRRRQYHEVCKRSYLSTAHVPGPDGSPIFCRSFGDGCAAPMRACRFAVPRHPAGLQPPPRPDCVVDGAAAQQAVRREGPQRGGALPAKRLAPAGEARPSD
jgi:hypothetical protein